MAAEPRNIAVKAFTELFGKKDVSAVDRYFGPAYVQHNTTVAVGGACNQAINRPCVASRRRNIMNRRTTLALTMGLLFSGVGLLMSNGIGHAQQSDVDKIKATIDGFHAALSSLDIRKMDDVWAHEPYAMVVNPRDKTATTGWDAIRKNFEGSVFAAWSELKVTGRDAPQIHINGETAWSNGIAVASGKLKAGGDAVNAPTFETAIFEKRGDRWLIVSWSAWRVPQ